MIEIVSLWTAKTIAGTDGPADCAPLANGVHTAAHSIESAVALSRARVELRIKRQTPGNCAPVSRDLYEMHVLSVLGHTAGSGHGRDIHNY